MSRGWPTHSIEFHIGAGSLAQRFVAMNLQDLVQRSRSVALQVEGDPTNAELRLTAVTAHDKVAAYLTPKLKSIEHTGAGGGPIVLQSVTGDEHL